MRNLCRICSQPSDPWGMFPICAQCFVKLNPEHPPWSYPTIYCWRSRPLICWEPFLERAFVRYCRGTPVEGQMVTSFWRTYFIRGNQGLGVMDRPTWAEAMRDLPTYWRTVFGGGHPSREELDAIDSTP